MLILRTYNILNYKDDIHTPVDWAGILLLRRILLTFVCVTIETVDDIDDDQRFWIRMPVGGAEGKRGGRVVGQESCGGQGSDSGVRCAGAGRCT